MAESRQEYDLIYFNGITKMMEVERNKIHLVHSYFHNFFTAYQKFYEKTGLSLKTIVTSPLSFASTGADSHLYRCPICSYGKKQSKRYRILERKSMFRALMTYFFPSSRDGKKPRSKLLRTMI